MYNPAVERDKMQKHLFLTGGSGSDKTEIIKNVLGDKLSLAGGFFCASVLDENGEALFTELLPAAAAGGVDGFEGGRFLDCSVAPPSHDSEVFRTTGVRLLEEAVYYPFALMDEFGGFEILIPEFREALLDLLSGDLPCIGVLKSLPDAEALKNQLSLGDKYIRLLSSLTDALKNDTDTLIFELGKASAEETLNVISSWAKEYT